MPSTCGSLAQSGCGRRLLWGAAPAHVGLRPLGTWQPFCPEAPCLCAVSEALSPTGQGPEPGQGSGSGAGQEWQFRLGFQMKGLD